MCQECNEKDPILQTIVAIFLLQGIFSTQRLNLHWQMDFLPLNHQRSPFEWMLLFYVLKKQTWIRRTRTLLSTVLTSGVGSEDKTLMLGKTEGRRRRGWQRTRWLDGITDSMDMVWASSGSRWWTGKPGMLQTMGSQRVGHNCVIEL